MPPVGAAARHPAPARAHQPRHHIHPPPGHRQRRDHRHRPRSPPAPGPRRRIAQTLSRAAAPRPKRQVRRGSRRAACACRLLVSRALHRLMGMYEVDGRDRVVELADVPQSSVGAPLPVVVDDESTLQLAYYLSVPDPDWDGSYTRVVEAATEDPIILVHFEGAYAARTGALLAPPSLRVRLPRLDVRLRRAWLQRRSAARSYDARRRRDGLGPPTAVAAIGRS